jgi:hypothetical protein
MMFIGGLPMRLIAGAILVHAVLTFWGLMRIARPHGELPDLAQPAMIFIGIALLVFLASRLKPKEPR